MEPPGYCNGKRKAAKRKSPEYPNKRIQKSPPVKRIGQTDRAYELRRKWLFGSIIYNKV